MVGLSVSEADSLVESQLCDIVFSNERFGVVRSFLRRCLFQVISVTGALKLRLIRVFQNTQRQCWQSGNQFQIKALGLATNKAFKRDSQRLAVLV